jgi:hypothetical protein
MIYNIIIQVKMYVYDIYDPNTSEINSITGSSVIELCANVLNYKIDCIKNDDDEYTVKFYNSNKKLIIEVTENGLYFAITGQTLNNSELTENIKNDSEKFWNIIHSNVKLIEFTNPIRFGDAEWDEDYEEDSDDEEEDNTNETNIVITKEKQC